MFTAESSLYFILALGFRHCSLTCVAVVWTPWAPPALPCPVLDGAACPAVPPALCFQHETIMGFQHGIRVMHKVHLSDVTPVTSGQLELSPWQRGMATELCGRSSDRTQRASQQKRKPYIVIPSFTFLWCNSEKYQICWITDVFTPLMSCAPVSALPRTAPQTPPHLFQRDFMPCSEQHTPKSSRSCFPPRSAAAAEQLL